MSNFSERRRLVFGLPAVLACLALPAGAGIDDDVAAPPPSDPDRPDVPDVSDVPVRRAGALRDYGDPHFQDALAGPLALPPAEWSGVFRWLQIGDSHTAGDYFTGELRRRLQARYGDAGIGWITPGYVNGQRSDSVKLSSENGWSVQRASRLKLEPQAVPFGGELGSVGTFAAPPPAPPGKKSQKKSQKKSKQKPAPPPPGASTAAGLRLTYKHPEPLQPMRVSVLRSRVDNTAVLEVASDVGRAVSLPPLLPDGGPWQMTTQQVDLGGEHVWLRVAGAAKEPLATVAGIAIEKPAPGVVVDAVGVNGAQIDELLGWSEDALSAALTARPPNVVVLEFGTNESVGRRFDAAAYIDKVTTAVRRLRLHSSAAIVLMVPPDMHRAAKVGRRRRKPETCGLQPEWLQAVTDALAHVARHEKTLLWDWGEWVRATGATCGTFSLAHMTPSLARPDYVHFSPEGYKATAESFLEDLFHLVGVHDAL
jgi:lysophospholipase L1-like esterase